MIVDFHMHSFPDAIAAPALAKLAETAGIAPVGRATVSDTLEKLEQWRVDRGVLLNIATNPRQQGHINDHVIRINREHGDRVTAFGSVHFANEDITAELERLYENGVQGIKIHPTYQACLINDKRWEEAYRACERLGLIVVAHAGYDPYDKDVIWATPRQSAEVVDAFPKLKLVLAHLGGLYQWDEVERELVGKNVYFDTAMCDGQIDPAQYLRIIRHHGSQRIVLGSDCPWHSTEQEIARLRTLGLTDVEERRILGENAAELLGLS